MTPYERIKEHSALLADWAEEAVDSIRVDEERAEILYAAELLLADRNEAQGQIDSACRSVGFNPDEHAPHDRLPITLNALELALRKAEKERDAANARADGMARAPYGEFSAALARAKAAEERCATLEQELAEAKESLRTVVKEDGVVVSRVTARCATLEAVVQKLAYFGDALVASEYEPGSTTVRELVNDARAALATQPVEEKGIVLPPREIHTLSDDLPGSY